MLLLGMDVLLAPMLVKSRRTPGWPGLSLVEGTMALSTYTTPDGLACASNGWPFGSTTETLVPVRLSWTPFPAPVLELD